MILETKRLRIRPISLNDTNEVFEYRRNRLVNRYQAWIPETIDDVVAFIENVAGKVNEPNTWFQFVIIDKKTERIIGDLGIHFLEIDNKNDQVEVGCTLSEDFQNQGYATEAVKRIVDYLFIDLSKHKITALIDPDNRNSIRLVERIGFRKENHSGESELINEKRVDELVYVLTKND